jgi:pyruvate/2-oxoglutarate/acetoin dehydrogenase E1 component
VILLGEDISVYGGAFGVTKDLWKHFGKERVINTPISENSFVGVGVGTAIMGMRPVVEIMFMDFITLACDQIINHAAKLPFIYAGQVRMPMVIRTPIGAGRGYGASHSQSLERLFMGVPGIKIVCPYTPSDAKGLLKAAIRDDNLSLFIEHKLLYSQEGRVPEKEYLLDLSKAEILKPGKDLTLISYSKMLDYCLEIAEEISCELDIEVIDLRSLKPLDLETIAESVKKTGRVVFVEEGPKIGGIGAEVCSQIAENCLEYLNGRVVRVGAQDFPIPSSRPLEDEVLPNKDKIIKAIKKALVF